MLSVRENQKDETMGNQQERFEIDLAWLAGFIEGEGWVSLIYYTNQQKKGKTVALTPNIGVVNTDPLLMGKVKEIFDKMGIKYRYQLRKAGIGSDGILRKEKIEMSLISHKNIKIFAPLILPYMIGEKRKRLEKILQYIALRESKPKSGINSKYGPEEFAIYDDLYSYKGKSRSKILNDYTPGSDNKEKI